MSKKSIHLSIFDGTFSANTTLLFVKEEDLETLREYKSELPKIPDFCFTIKNQIVNDDLWLLAFFGAAFYLEKINTKHFHVSGWETNQTNFQHAIQGLSTLRSEIGNWNKLEAIDKKLKCLHDCLPPAYSDARLGLDFVREYYLNILLPMQELHLFTVPVKAPLSDPISKSILILKKQIESLQTTKVRKFLNPIHECLAKISLDQSLSDEDLLYEYSGYCLWLSRIELQKKNATVSIMLLHRACDLLIQSICCRENLITSTKEGFKYTQGDYAKEKIYLKSSLELLSSNSLYVIERNIIIEFFALNRARNDCLLGHGTFGHFESDAGVLHQKISNAVKALENGTRWVNQPNKFEIGASFEISSLLSSNTALATYITLPSNV